VALPVSLGTATVSFLFLKNDGTPETGSVTFTRSVYLRSPSDDAVVTPGNYSVALDGTGAGSAVVIVTNDDQWLPQGWTYTVLESLSSGQRTYTIEVTGDVNLADVAPVNDPSAGATYILKTQMGEIAGPAGPLDETGKIPEAQLPAIAGGPPEWTDVLNKPTEFPPEDHTHAQSEVTGLVTALNDKASTTHTHIRPNPAPVALVDGTTIATDASLGNHFRVTLGGNRTLSNPTSPVDGQKVLWEFTQDATGGRTITLGSQFTNFTGLASLVAATGAGKRTYMGAIWKDSTSTWDVLAWAVQP
jgi:hypothetical protein